MILKLLEIWGETNDAMWSQIAPLPGKDLLRSIRLNLISFQRGVGVRLSCCV